MSLLDVAGVDVTFGGLTALRDVSMTVDSGEVVGVIGPNGAGKTTLFNVICGFVRPDSGVLTWQGRPIRRLRPQLLAKLGIARTLQGLGLFGHLSVLDNVVVGADRHARWWFGSGLMAAPWGDREEASLVDRAMAALEELDVARYARRLPGQLPYGVQKRVALARALVSEPKLLLLDEPASGLSAAEMDELGELVRGLRSRMSVLLVEHHMDLVMSVCDRITVLDFGRCIATGSPAEVQGDPRVVEAYLGETIDADTNDVAEEAGDARG